jgi:hypothetical protein
MNADELNDFMERAWSSMPKAPQALTEDFYRSGSCMEDVDDSMWIYLCNLIPKDQRPSRVRIAEMLDSVSPQLKGYYLTRGFDWERGSGGLESCLMHEPEDDVLFLEETIEAYKQLGALKHAAIIRDLIPKARERLQMINEADAKGEDFNYDDGFWGPYEARWVAASEEFNFYDVIWKDMRAHPEKYTHEK